MHLAVFSAKPHDRCFLDAANARGPHGILYLETALDRHTAALADGHVAVSIYIDDRADASALAVLAAGGTRLITLRSACHSHVDLEAARRLGLTVSYAPDYSPHAVAEHAVALLLSLVRRIPHAYSRVREGNFSVEGLLGFDLHGKTVAIVGAGRIGLVTGRILRGFGCRVLACDPHPSAEALAEGFTFGPLQEVLGEADVVSLHCPLLPATRHLVNRSTLAWFKRGAVLINTSRGGLLDSHAVIEALGTGRLSAVGIDLYEDEARLGYDPPAGQGAHDDITSRLISLSNVLVTGHQAYFTREAVSAISRATLAAVDAFAAGRAPAHLLVAPAPAPAI
ncbi:MAG: 2-hydroxyacid dehydrogenase [Opitutaceae bacterium]|jgi:D-lactate dehydrogenase|nr:2-hydroxyacid dehydrogenase [Opitutaceae bacterium]